MKEKGGGSAIRKKKGSLSPRGKNTEKNLRKSLQPAHIETSLKSDRALPGPEKRKKWGEKREKTGEHRLPNRSTPPGKEVSSDKLSGKGGGKRVERVGKKSRPQQK